MVRDPLYRKIEQRLGERLDPHLFERCAVELLRDAYPGLAPVTGGADAGMDGAVTDETGDALPLIATTATDVIGNLTRSLKSYGRTEGSATAAILATSRALTPQKRRNLEARAWELGFTLRNIHDRDDFTGRLYGNSTWRLELLGLRGDPPALSALPRLVGPCRTGELIGRDNELARFRRHRGDLVVVGQPGVGKTALFETLAREDRGLFVVSDDPGRIADAFRDNPVSLLFVDDAHFNGPLIDLLVRLREEPGLDFRICASTWPNRAEVLEGQLYLCREERMAVNGLARDQVAQLIRREEPRLPEDVIGEILNQSENPPDGVLQVTGSCRPGLAMTLARHTDLRGIEPLIRGRLLLEGLRRDARLSGTELDYVATLAVGGEAGMRQDAAARALHQPPLELRQALLRLSGTGTLTETWRGALAVGPAALRHALVARTYFSGAMSLSPEAALQSAEDAVACSETLLGALGRGGEVPHRLIQERLREHREAGVGNRPLDMYAATGAEGANWVLENYPDRASSIASDALTFAPEWVLGRLISLAIESECGSRDRRWETEFRGGFRALEQTRSGDLVGQIGVWVRAGRPGSDAVDRRRQLLRALAEHGELVEKGREAAAELVRSCFSLGFLRMRGDPVSVEKFTMGMGSLAEDDVRRLARLWPKAMELLRNLGDPGIRCARSVIRRWVTGPRVPGELPETSVASRAEVARMLELALDAWVEPGFLHWAHGIVREHKLNVTLPRVDDQTVVQLFPTLDQRLSADPAARHFDAVARRFAQQWCHEEPGVVAERMLRLRREGKFSGYHGTRPLDLIAVQLAELVDDPSAWLEAFAERAVPGAWVGPLLDAAAIADPSDEVPWRILERVDPVGEYAGVSLQAGLRLRDPPAMAVHRVLAAARAHPGFMRDVVPWAHVPDAWKLRLLRDGDGTVRGGTAAALWDLHHRRRPPGEMGVLWEDAAVTCGGADLLHDVVGSDRRAALAWLFHEAEESSQRKDEGQERAEELVEETSCVGRTIAQLLAESETLYSLDTELVVAARETIRSEDRRRLIRDIPADADPRFFGYLVGGDRDLYAVLLARRAPQEAHLAPLRTEPAPANLDELARMAMEHGYAVADLEHDPGQPLKSARWSRARRTLLSD
ncbi:hypothetical protein [Candidatus Palauibacter sp.]|uniref:hypothetical protein n=1 Tax=Candidatus Palauibacter sp. TaxID=3101350 RepID=UPI003B5B0625